MNNNQVNFEIHLKFQELVAKYNFNKERSKQDLLEILEKYEVEIIDEYSRNEFLNIDLAKNIIIVFKELLKEYNDFDTTQKKYILAALQYFIEIEDDDDDFESFFGFEDDAEIVNEMLLLIDKKNLVIEF